MQEWCTKAEVQSGNGINNRGIRGKQSRSAIPCGDWRAWGSPISLRLHPHRYNHGTEETTPALVSSMEVAFLSGTPHRWIRQPTEDASPFPWGEGGGEGEFVSRAPGMGAFVRPAPACRLIGSPRILGQGAALAAAARGAQSEREGFVWRSLRSSAARLAADFQPLSHSTLGRMESARSPKKVDLTTVGISALNRSQAELAPSTHPQRTLGHSSLPA